VFIDAAVVDSPERGDADEQRPAETLAGAG
jgi:hypothetical protein